MKKISFENIFLDIINVSSTVENILSNLRKEPCGFMEEDIFDIKVIANEMITNAIKYGNCFDYKKRVRIVVVLLKDKYIYISVEDEGCGYDYDSRLNILENKFCGNFNEGGRGLQILNCMCDKVKFNKKGNKISIIKRIDI